jgi:hypothetical protein
VRPGIVAFSVGTSTSLVGILGGLLLYRFGGAILTDMYSMTGCVDRAAPLTLFSRRQGISAREMFS